MGGTPGYGTGYLIYDTETGKWMSGTPQKPRWTDSPQMARRYRTKSHVTLSFQADNRYRKSDYPDTWMVVEMEMRFRHMEPLNPRLRADK